MKQFAVVVAASVVAALISEYLINNVRAIRRTVGSL